MIRLEKEEKAFLCSWFSSVLSHELTEEQLKQYQEGVFEPLFELLSELGFEDNVQQIKSEIAQVNAMPYSQLELAADFTQLFLLSGQSSALPYASAYLNDKYLSNNLNYVDGLLDKFKLQVSEDCKEPSDHLAVYLEVLNKLILESSDEEQQKFVQEYLLIWLEPFNIKVQKIKTKTMFYQNLLALLVLLLTSK